MRAKYVNRKDGEGFAVRSGRMFRLRCCDCGLVHKFDFRVHRGRIEIRAFRDNRATAAIRRWMKAEA